MADLTNITLNPATGGGSGGDWFAQNAPGTVGITDPGQGPQGQPGGGTPAPGNAGPANGDWQGWFQQLTGGKPLDQAGLLALAPQLQAAGVQITPPSAAGVQSKIGIPDGQGGFNWVRVLNGDTSVASPTVWMAQGGGGTQGADGGGFGTLGGGTTPLSDLASGSNPLSDILTQAASGLESSPGYQFQLQQGLQGLDRGAAAKGTLLTGGTAKAEDRYAQDYAQNAYNSRVNQLLGVQQTRFNQLSGEQAQRAGQLANLSALGLGAAGQQATLGQGYATTNANLSGSQAVQTGDLLTGAGNAGAAGTIGSANAWANGISQVGGDANNALQMYYLSKLYGGGGGGTIPTPAAGYGVVAPPATTVGPYAGGYQFPQ